MKCTFILPCFLYMLLYICIMFYSLFSNGPLTYCFRMYRNTYNIYFKTFLSIRALGCCVSVVDTHSHTQDGSGLELASQLGFLVCVEFACLSYTYVQGGPQPSGALCKIFKWGPLSTEKTPHLLMFILTKTRYNKMAFNIARLQLIVLHIVHPLHNLVTEIRIDHAICIYCSKLGPSLQMWGPMHSACLSEEQHCLCGVLSGCSGFLQQPKDRQVRSSGYSKSPIGVNVNVNSCSSWCYPYNA